MIICKMNFVSTTNDRALWPRADHSSSRLPSFETGHFHGIVHFKDRRLWPILTVHFGPDLQARYDSSKSEIGLRLFQTFSWNSFKKWMNLKTDQQ